VVNVSGAMYTLKNLPRKLLGKLEAHRNRMIGILHTDTGYAIRVIDSKMRVQACPQVIEHARASGALGYSARRSSHGKRPTRG